jgi:hypothetical protein
MTYLLAIHKVADFTDWKRGYENSLAARRKAGLKEKYLLRSTEDPNEIILLHEVEYLQKAQEFTRSPGWSNPGCWGSPRDTSLLMLARHHRTKRRTARPALSLFTA